MEHNKRAYSVKISWNLSTKPMPAMTLCTFHLAQRLRGCTSTLSGYFSTFVLKFVHPPKNARWLNPGANASSYASSSVTRTTDSWRTAIALPRHPDGPFARSPALLSPPARARGRPTELERHQRLAPRHRAHPEAPGQPPPPRPDCRRVGREVVRAQLLRECRDCDGRPAGYVLPVDDGTTGGARRAGGRGKAYRGMSAAR